MQTRPRTQQLVNALREIEEASFTGIGRVPSITRPEGEAEGGEKKGPYSTSTSTRMGPILSPNGGDEAASQAPASSQALPFSGSIELNAGPNSSHPPSGSGANHDFFAPPQHQRQDILRSTTSVDSSVKGGGEAPRTHGDPPSEIDSKMGKSTITFPTSSVGDGGAELPMAADSLSIFPPLMGGAHPRPSQAGGVGPTSVDAPPRRSSLMGSSRPPPINASPRTSLMGGVPQPLQVGTWEGLPNKSLVKHYASIAAAPTSGSGIRDATADAMNPQPQHHPQQQQQQQQHKASAEGAVAWRLGTFRFKGSEEAIPMVNVAPVGLRERR